jgi:hypothetical protein
VGLGRRRPHARVPRRLGEGDYPGIQGLFCSMVANDRPPSAWGGLSAPGGQAKIDFHNARRMQGLTHACGWQVFAAWADFSLRRARCRTRRRVGVRPGVGGGAPVGEAEALMRDIGGESRSPGRGTCQTRVQVQVSSGRPGRGEWHRMGPGGPDRN